jgi:carbon-monoxide dehydrogenase medium subunit
MKYIEPDTLTGAIEILASDDEARCFAGGATLVAMMNAELVEPSIMIGLQGIKELNGIKPESDYLRIGAMTSHAELASAENLKANAFIVRDAARQIAHPAIRNMGTIGGSICHADPAADFPGALVAADALVEIAGPNGQRQIPVDELFVDYLETSLEEAEILTAILVPNKSDHCLGRHLKFSRTHGDYATVSISLVLSMEAESCGYARIVAGSVAPTPLHLDAVDELLTNSSLDDEIIKQAGQMLQEASDPIDDVRGSANYRRKIIPGLLQRAIREVQGELQNG